MTRQDPEFSHLPTFSEIKINGIESGLDRILQENRAAIGQLEKIPEPDWNSFVYPLDLLGDRLDRFWSPIRHLNSVMNNPELRKAYNAGIKLISQYSTEIGQNQALYRQYESIRQSSFYAALSPGQQKAIDDNLRDFRLSGVSLDEQKKEQFKSIALQLSELASRFAENVLDSTNAWSKLIEHREELTGLPDHALDAAAQRAKDKSLDGWLLNLEFPTYYAIQTFADNRELRRELYTAYSTRASDQGPHDKKFNNDELIEQILQLRQQQAKLIGFQNYAEYSIESKMVESPARVMEFLEQLLDKSSPRARQEFKDLEDFAKRHGLTDKLQAWDVMYYSNKLKEDVFAISEEDLKPYFPANVVIPGLFKVVKKLFGLRIERIDDVDVWHKDVGFYRIRDAAGKTRGGFYLDIYARDNKRGGAWMDECVSRMRIDDEVQLPVAYLTCNLTPPLGDEPALLTHNEVITLFHEFGHGLQHMLTQVDFRDVSGINGVEWDAVELPSQFLENWCWDTEALQMISAHYRSGENIPADLLEKARQAKNFQSAMLMLRQLEFAEFDMQIHTRAEPLSAGDVQQILDQVRARAAVVPVPS
ncbi:MAG: M3 family metallopeptidase, partial [Gammaproteobacteria bacterium]|nr:M3 family metallopeptidase [Gammaproteobacteria bacterium]